MRLTTKGRFGVTAMIDLAMRADRGPVALGGIGSRQQISLSYLEQLFGKLRQCALVTSTRGPGGGYSLARAAADISVADIIRAVDEAGDAAGGGERRAGARLVDAHGMTQSLWAGLETTMLAYLDSVSLGELVERQLARGVSAGEPARQRPTGFAPIARPRPFAGPNSVFALGSSLAARAAEVAAGTTGLERKTALNGRNADGARLLARVSSPSR